jgi:MFS family permease
MVFGMSLTAAPSWRVMLGVLSIPSLFYFILTIFFLPESPRWLVSKGRMLEAKKVLQRLRGQDDVSGNVIIHKPFFIHMNNGSVYLSNVRSVFT